MASCRIPLIYLMLLALLAAPLGTAQAERTGSVVGSLDITGSDTLARLMMDWGRLFEAHYPGVRLQLQATGSATAPPALTQGTTRIGAMSRPMTSGERTAFVTRQGYLPTVVTVAIDALAVFVHRNNPLEAISLPALDALFSDTRRCGAESPINHWGQLGLTGRWRDLSIDLHGRVSASGTYGIFKDEVLCNGDFRPSVNEYTGSSAVVAAVAHSPTGIGYAGAGYLTASVKPLALINEQGQRVEPTVEAAIRGDYPLTRPLYLYVNLPPQGKLPPLEQAFFDLVLSAKGQALVRENGFVPLPQEGLAEARKELRLETR